MTHIFCACINFSRRASLKAWSIAVLALSVSGYHGDAGAARCLYISSYHAGYEWNDGIERGIHGVLDSQCEVDKFYMDTKRNKSEAFGTKMARAAQAHIEATEPDVVIACDDNASKYLVEPYLKDAALPVVFCGINWTVQPYGYPYSNATGMVEISPIKPLLEEVQNVVEGARHGLYLAPDVISQRKEYELNRRIYAKQGIEIRSLFVKTMSEWEAGYIKAQGADFVIVGNNAGINDWDSERAARHTLEHTSKLTVTNYEWMSRYTMLSMTKVAEEQGEWAAKVAMAILSGESPRSIPIVVNRRWNIFVNTQLLDKANLALDPHILHKAVKVGE